MSGFKRIGSVCIKYGCPGVMHIGVLDATAVIEGDVELGVELFVRDKASPQAAQPVAWQYRVSAGPQTGWSLWHDGKGEEFKDSYQVETRPLYTHADAGEVVHPIYEVESLSDGGGGWFEVDKEKYERCAKSPKIYNVRVVYLSTPKGISEWQRGRDGMRAERDKWIEESETLRAQLAERDALLGRAQSFVAFVHKCVRKNKEYAPLHWQEMVELDRDLSTTAKPETGQ